METLLLHPKLVHLPIALAVLMPLISAGLLLSWVRGWLPKRAWLVAVALQATLVVTGLASLKTGELDEDRVEQVVGEARLETHEHAAQRFTVVAALVLLVAVGASLLKAERPARALGAAAALGTLVVLVLGYQTGRAGGTLVYEAGGASVFASPSGPAATRALTGDDDGERAVRDEMDRPARQRR
jgi:uncharacterized membrane protein